MASCISANGPISASRTWKTWPRWATRFRSSASASMKKVASVSPVARRWKNVIRKWLPKKRQTTKLNMALIRAMEGVANAANIVVETATAARGPEEIEAGVAEIAADAETSVAVAATVARVANSA